MTSGCDIRISVITVSFNAEATISDTMQSVFDQELPPGVSLDYIVIDGASRDGTVERVREFEEKVRASGRGDFSFRWKSEPDKGLYDAMNKGIAMAEGEYIGILNADDMMDSPGSVAAVAAAARPDIDVLFADIRFVSSSAKYATLSAERTFRYVCPKNWKPWKLSWGFTPPHPGLYIRKSAYDKWGAYLVGYEISSDDEIIVRLVRRNGAKAAYLPKCLVAMRLGGKSTRSLGNILLQNREFVEMNRANGYFCCLPMMLPKMFIKLLEIIRPRLSRRK